MPTVLKLGSKGPQVARLQRALTAAGRPLKDDGDFGPKTASAVRLYQESFGYSPPDERVDLTWVELLEREARTNVPVVPSAPTPAPAPIPIPIPIPAPAPTPPTTTLAERIAKMTHEDFTAYMIDRRKFHRPMTRDAQKKPIFYYPDARQLDQITGACLHQTACDMGVNPERYDTISVHFVVLQNGEVLWECDEEWVLFHGNGYNAKTIGIEVNGRYSGLLDDPRTAHDEALATTWDDPTTKWRELPQDLTPEAAAALERLVIWIHENLRRKCVAAGKAFRLTKLVPHRSASATRQNDPGQAIWTIAVRLMKTLGLDDGGPGFVIPGSGGRPVPEAWDPRRVGVKY
jgi:hypothetical protein